MPSTSSSRRGIGIPSIADMDAHQTIVTAALAAKSGAETPKKARSETTRAPMMREISAEAFGLKEVFSFCWRDYDVSDVIGASRPS